MRRLPIVLALLLQIGWAQQATLEYAARLPMRGPVASARTSNGDILVLGGGDLPNSDYMILRVDSNNRTTIVRRLDTGGRGRFDRVGFEDITVDAEDNILVTGWARELDQITEHAFQRSCTILVFSSSPCAFLWKLSPDGQTTIFATFLGGSYSTTGDIVRVAPDGTIFVAGETSSVDFPVTANAPQSKRGGGDYHLDMGGDAFLAQFDATGSKLLFATYLGGHHSERASEIYFGPDGSVILAGQTGRSYEPSPNDFPTTPGVGSAGGGDDFFVTRYDIAASKVIFSARLGGQGYDALIGAIVDHDGSLIIAGETKSPDFPVTDHPFQTGLKGRSDIFIARLSSAGIFLKSVVLGGTSIELGRPVGISPKGTVFFTGSTLSLDFPMKKAFQPTHNPGAHDCYEITEFGCRDLLVFALDHSLTKLKMASYLGGSDNEGSARAVHYSQGEITYIASSNSVDFPVTSNAVVWPDYFWGYGSTLSRIKVAEDFTLSVPSQSLGPDGTGATLPVSVRSVGLGPTESIKLTCEGLPKGWACDFSQNAISLDDGDAEVKLTLKRVGPVSGKLALLGLPLVSLFFRRSFRRGFIPILALVFLCSCSVAPTESASTEVGPREIRFSLVGTAGSLRHEIPLTVVVRN